MKIKRNKMALKDIFKKQSSKKEDNKDKKEVAKVVAKKIEKKSVKKVSKKETKAKKKTSEGLAYRVLRFPHITEKANMLTENNQYIFVVYNDVNKIEIRKAFEALYGVKVASVQIVNVSKKRRRVGKTFGWRKAYKKAIVKIKDGQKIDEMIR